jgi:uncharacterized Zn finger protein
MPIFCPGCHTTTTRWLEGSSDGSIVDYYRCDTCGQVWTVSKVHPQAPPKTVVRGRTPVSGPPQ